MIKGYIGTDKNKNYKPCLFQEIMSFYKDAPKRALKIFWNHLKNKQYREAIDLLKQFLKLDIPEDVIQDFLRDEEESITIEGKKKIKYPKNGFLPNAPPYYINKRDKNKAKKYWNLGVNGMSNKMQSSYSICQECGKAIDNKKTMNDKYCDDCYKKINVDNEPTGNKLESQFPPDPWSPNTREVTLSNIKQMLINGMNEEEIINKIINKNKEK